MEYPIDNTKAGITVKAYLHRILGLSGTQVTALKKDPQGILVNGVHVTVRHVLAPGETLSLATEDKTSSDAIVPVELPLCILYEDRDLIAVNKPPYMPTHPSHGHYEDTLANGLAAYYAKRGEPFVFRSVSRLDRDTSGVVTVAKNRASAYRFHTAHLSGEIRKTYLAVLCGDLSLDAGEIGGCIKRVEDSVITRQVTEHDGAPALTRYRVIARGRNPRGAARTLVAAEPVTGRTHQLRVHFASLGAPICGDFLYGEEAPEEIGRQALHAFKIAFCHPVTGTPMTLCAAPPPDFRALLSCFPFADLTDFTDFTFL